MTDQERQYIIDSFIQVQFNQPLEDIQRALLRRFGHAFTQNDINSEKLSLYRKIRNGNHNTIKNIENGINAIGEALEKTTDYIDPQNHLIIEKFRKMFHIWQSLCRLQGMDDQTETEDMPYDQFQALVCEKMNFAPGRKGWFLGFMSATGNKYDYKNQTKWRKSGWVPKEAVIDAENMQIDIAVTTATKPQVRWSDEIKTALYKFLIIVNDKLITIESHTNKTIAADLSKQFSLPITAGMVKRQIHNLRDNMDDTAQKIRVVNMDAYKELFFKFGSDTPDDNLMIKDLTLSEIYPKKITSKIY